MIYPRHDYHFRRSSSKNELFYANLLLAEFLNATVFAMCFAYCHVVAGHDREKVQILQASKYIRF